ncbi:hypothetical protein Tco_0260338 [Tanacetum coccineum]
MDGTTYPTDYRIAERNTRGLHAAWHAGPKVASSPWPRELTQHTTPHLNNRTRQSTTSMASDYLNQVGN